VKEFDKLVNFCEIMENNDLLFGPRDK